MSRRRHRTTDGRDDLGTLVHAELDDYGLDPYAFRVYAHMARRAGKDGVHWESVANTAAVCCISERRVRSALRLLEEQGLVTRQEILGSSSEYRLTPKREWRAPLRDAAPRHEVPPSPEATPAPDADPPAPHADPPRHEVPPTPAPGAPEVKPLKLGPDQDLPPLPPTPAAAGEPSAADKPPRRESSKRLHWAMVQAWNDHRGTLPRCTGVTPTLSKMLDRALKDIEALDLDGSGRPPDPAEVIRRATMVVAADPYWLEHRYSLQNLLAGGKFTGKAEAYRPPSEAPGQPEPRAPPTRETEWATVLRLATPAGASSLPSSLTPPALEALAVVGGWIQVASAVDEADAGDSAYLLDLAKRFRAAYEAHDTPHEEVQAA